jgi:TIR domain
MADAFEATAARATRAVAELLERQGDAELGGLLRASEPWIEERGQDFGVSYYQLNLEVPVETYAKIEPRLDQAEQTVLAKTKAILRSRLHEAVSSVVIAPILEPPMAEADSAPANAADHIWDSGMLRLFISHVHTHKAAVGVLKSHLQVMGISGFVAHADIAPTLEWQAEIDLALRTTQAALALLTSDFHDSKWTDQEVGVAMARGVLIIPVNLGVVPYGFMGKYQQLGGSLDQPEALADEVFAILSKRPATLAAMREGLVTALEQANTYKAARKVSKLLATTQRDFTDVQLGRIRTALADNNQVSEATGVPRMLATIVGEPPASK